MKSQIRPAIGLFIIAAVIMFTVWIIDIKERKKIFKSVAIATFLVAPVVYPVAVLCFFPKDDHSYRSSNWLNLLIDKAVHDSTNKFQFSLAQLMFATSVIAFMLGIFKSIFSFDDLTTIYLATLAAISSGIAVLIPTNYHLTLRFLIAIAVMAFVISVMKSILTINNEATALLLVLVTLTSGGAVLIGRIKELTVVIMIILMYLSIAVLLGISVAVVYWIRLHIA